MMGSIWCEDAKIRMILMLKVIRMRGYLDT